MVGREILRASAGLCASLRRRDLRAGHSTIRSHADTPVTTSGELMPSHASVSARSDHQPASEMALGHEHARQGCRSSLVAGLFNGLHQAAHIPDGIEASPEAVARPIVGLSLQGGDVVWTHGALEADPVVCLHGSEHVRVAIVVKGFGKVAGRSTNVPKVSEEHPVLAAESLDGGRNVGAHLRKTPLAECDSTGWAGHEIYDPLESIRMG